ncbi:MAG TPA: hypothetical protein VMQ76_05995, partial [Terracidiphilus sp.]|nr:hypothetical protein [Terracidiphilus sp.]
MVDEKISQMPDGSAGAQPSDLIPFVSPGQSPKNVSITLEELAEILLIRGYADGLVLNGIASAEISLTGDGVGNWNLANDGLLYVTNTG